MGTLFGFFAKAASFVAGMFSGRKKGREDKHQGMSSGGYGSWTWHNIMKAHCDPDDLVEEFGLDMEGCSYDIPYFGQCAWDQAYQEMLARVEATAAMLGCDPEELIDEEEVAELAYDLAYEYSEMLFTGDYWVDEDFLNWGYYDVSDHNN